MANQSTDSEIFWYIKATREQAEYMFNRADLQKLPFGTFMVGIYNMYILDIIAQ